MVRSPCTKGFTLIELIVFIVVAGIFIPMAYIAFLAVARPYREVSSGLAQATPQTVLTARFLAEFKIEDISKAPYTVPFLQPYIAVERFPGDGEFSRYQWHWEIAPVIYISGHSTLTTPDSYPRPIYAIGDYVIPPNPNGRSYQVYFPPWTASRQYSEGNNIRADNGHVYRCTREHMATPPQPTWTPNPGDKIQVDGLDTWEEDTSMTPGGSPPWTLQTAGEFDDGSLHWRERTIYLQITVSVREPNGYEYKARTVLSARPTVYP
jgi:prepilin-type N-terminal cleavage/methylation domain-containing protein